MTAYPRTLLGTYGYIERELVTAVFRVPVSGRGAWVAAVCGPLQGGPGLD